MDRQREPEVGRQIAGDLGPCRTAVLRTVDTAVVLLEEPCGIAGIDVQLVHALAEVGRRSGVEVRADTLVAGLPRRAAVGCLERADGRDADPHVIGVRWIERNRMQDQAAGSGHPLRAARMVAQSSDVRPRLAAVVAAEETSRLDAG